MGSHREHQHQPSKHTHSHHEPSRYIHRPSTALPPSHTRSGLDIINPRILDASIRDVTERLSSQQKAEVLIHAMNLLKLANPFSHHIIENGVMSCLQVGSMSVPQRVQAYLLRGRARMSSGDMLGARKDLNKVLELVPDHAVATSLLSIPSNGSGGIKDKSRLWNIDSASRRLSPEIWRHIASFLPRRDLKTLLHIPHVLSRIAFELVFQCIDLHIGACAHPSLPPPDGPSSASTSWKEDFKTDDDALRLEKWLSHRTAEIISRIIQDPAFAKLIKTLRISASKRDKRDRTYHMSFQTTMLLTALPKLVNLKEIIFVGANEVWNQLAGQIEATLPRLQALSVEPDHDIEPILPHLTHLTSLKFVKDHSCHSLPPFLAQNRSTMRKLCLCTYFNTFPSPAYVSLQHLTHLEFVGTIPAGSETVSQILSLGTQLISLRMTCVLLHNIAPQFRAHASTGLPRLRNFGFRVTNSLGQHAADAGLFPAIAEFLRAHPRLEKLELDVSGEANQQRLGYDASVLGVLPNLNRLRQLSIMMTKDASPGLFSWIVPRGLFALLLSGVPRRTEGFLNMLRPGLPPSLRFVALLETEVRDVATVIEAALPPSVRLVHMNNKYYTVRRKVDGHLDAIEEWPERRARLHAEEWLEAMGCEDALWDDFAPGTY